MRNLFRQYGDDEPAMPWRNLENIHHAMMAVKAMMRHVLWLRTERWEGVTHVSGDTCLRCERKVGVSAPIVLTGSLGVACHRTVRYEDISIRTLRILAIN